MSKSSDQERSQAAFYSAQNEAAWQHTVMTVLQSHGWVAFHINASIVGTGADGRPRYATAVTSQGRGFPDVLAIRYSRMVLIECKAQRGVVSMAQQQWHARLALVPGVEVYVLRPGDGQRLMEIAA